jgi:hypothetical protein
MVSAAQRQGAMAIGTIETRQGQDESWVRSHWTAEVGHLSGSESERSKPRSARKSKASFGATKWVRSKEAWWKR